jgi:hypothetical protein
MKPEMKILAEEAGKFGVAVGIVDAMTNDALI